MPAHSDGVAKSWPLHWTLVLAAIATSVFGCDRSPPLARISGTVTFENAPIKEGLIVFSNQQSGVYMTAKIEDGGYEVVTAQGEGVPPGDYNVAITPPVVDHPVGPILEPPKPVEYPQIPYRYRDASTSGFSVQLTEGDNQADFRLKK